MQPLPKLCGNICDDFITLCHYIRFSCNISNVTEEYIFSLYNPYKNLMKDSLEIIPRGFVYFPNLLKDYINYYTISAIDLGCMICRCLEHEHLEFLVSLKILIEYIRINNISVKLLLLRNKYKINYELYDICKSNSIYDKYLDAFLNNTRVKYEEIINTYEYENKYDTYFGYRNIYHGLLYAPTHLFNKQIKIWEIERDCTFDAFLDFFNIRDKNIKLNTEEIIKILDSRKLFKSNCK